MINNRDCFFYKKSDFINRLQDISPDSVCYIADTQQIYTHGRYFECNVTQAVVEQLIQNHGYLTAADLPVLTGGASPTPGEYVTGVSVGGHNVNVQKGKLSEINVGTASKLETPRKIELSGDLSGSIMFDGSQDVNIETIVHNSTTADRLTTPKTISLSSQATGQVSFDGSGNVDIPVTVNELDSKNSNNRDLNSLVTLNGYGGSLFYGIGGNTSVNKPSGVDWFGLFSFKSASGNYTTQILGSNNRLYSRSNADTSLGSWNTIAYLTDNVASATKLKNTRTFTISDGTNSGTASNFNGTGNVTLRLPGTINANIIGDITGDLHGNADTATKLQTGRNINGTLFDGTQNITTAQWGTARNLTIGNSTKSVNGSTNVSWTLSEIGAAAASHNHSASNITSGTLALARIPTGTTASTVALGNHTHSGYASSSHTHGTNNVTALTGYTEGSSTTTLSSSMSLNTALASLQNQIQTKVDSLADLGITATAAEINKLDGLATTAKELGYVHGVTSSIQTQLNNKANASALGSYALKDGSNASGTWAGLSKGIDSAVSSIGYVKYNIINNDKTTVGSTETGLAWGTPLESQESAFGNGQVLRLTWGDQFYTDIFAGPNDARTQYGIQWRQIAFGAISSGRQGGWRLLLDDYNYKNYTVTKTGEGASGTWNINISGTAAKANSVAWANVSGKPSSFTPSSHTHPISQITNRGTLKFTGAATGSYDGSGNLTINIPSGGMSSVSWSDISGKPSTFTPSSHTHNMNEISDASSQYVTAGTVTRKVFLCKNKTGNGWISRVALGLTNPTGQFSPAILSIGTNDGGTSWYDYTFTPDGHITNSRGEFALTSQIPSLSGYATQTWVNSQGFIKSATDTKNTAGSTNTSSKLFLIGATSQATSPITYSNSSVYTQSGQLYASRMNATSGFYETSDARLKNFKDDIKALDVVSEIPTKYFTWKSDESKTEHIGTSAQEIQKLYPDLVTENEDGVLSVDYTRLSIIALAAIKELKAQIDELKSKIN